MTCQHRNYRVFVNVVNMEDTGARMAEITINCDNCGIPFEFVGLPVGCDFYRPTSDLSGRKMNAPIVPEGTKQLAGLAGFSVKVVTDGEKG